MSTLKVKDLKAGMRVKEPILGKNGDIKVNAGEVLSNQHVIKLNDWNARKDKAGNVTNSVDVANPRGIEVETARGSVSDMPDIVMHPERSPLVEHHSKERLHSSMQVPVSIVNGQVVREDMVNSIGNEEVINDTIVNTDANAEQTRPVKRRGRPPKKDRAREVNN